jgi:hypothetical protein
MAQSLTDVQLDEPEPNGPAWHTLVSLLLVIHWFCVFVVLSANFFRSALQEDLVRVLRPYTRLLNFDPNFARFHLTHGSEDDDDHFVEVVSPDAPDEPVARYPQRNHLPGGEPRHRYQALASVLGFFSRREDDATCAELAKVIGAAAMSRDQLQRVVVRCRWHRAQPLELDRADGTNPADPNAPAYFETVYEADVWIAEDGSTQVLKKSSRREVAPATRNGSSS